MSERSVTHAAPGPGDDRDQLAAKFFEHLASERRLAAHTVSAYRRDLAALLSALEQTPLTEITPRDIRHVIATLHGKGLRPRSLARVAGFHSRLRSRICRMAPRLFAFSAVA